MLRCKFRVTEIHRTESGRTLQLTASNQKDGDNVDWSTWTPCGHFEIQVTNEEAFEKIDRMRPGDHYYLDINEITPDPSPAPSDVAATE